MSHSHGIFTGADAVDRVRAGNVVEIANAAHDRTWVGTVADVGSDDGEPWILLEPGWARWDSRLARERDVEREWAGRHWRVTVTEATIRSALAHDAVYLDEWLDEALADAADALLRAEAEVHDARHAHDRLRALAVLRWDR